MSKKIIMALFACLFLMSPIVAADFTVDEIIANLQTNQAAIKDMSADTVTTITSTMKGAKDMIQKGKILTKYPDKSRTETFSPIHQVMITNGDKMIIINKDTGQRTEQTLPVSAGNGQMNLEKAKEQFNFTVKKDGANYIITGTPKTDNKFLGKIEISIDPTLWLSKNVKIFTPQGKVMSESSKDYQNISDIWIASKTATTALTPMGKMTMEIEYLNIEVNRGVSDDRFEKSE